METASKLTAPMSDGRRAQIQQTRAASTPGRWVWDINPATKSVTLVGGRGVYVVRLESGPGP